MCTCIIESVDSISRDGLDMPYMYIQCDGYSPVLYLLL